MTPRFVARRVPRNTLRLAAAASGRLAVRARAKRHFRGLPGALAGALRVGALRLFFLGRSAGIGLFIGPVVGLGLGIA